MDNIDGTEHYDRSTEGPPPSLLVIVLDTNPFAWSLLSSTLPLPKAVANLLVFINAHLAFNHSNRVAVIASHCNRTAWLYPSSASQTIPAQGNGTSSISTSDANKYRPFALIEQEVLHNLRHLLSTTTPASIASTTTTMVSGALTLALSYINRLTLALSPQNPSTSSASAINASAPDSTHNHNASQLNSRILVVSTSGDLAAQYIPIMNLIFAAQNRRIPIDILKLAGDTVLLQQASYTTSGIFMSPFPLPSSSNDGAPSNPQPHLSLLPTLLYAYLPDAHARLHLIPSTSTHIDFRAACFCHRRVVDLGFVCSICLSIFCEDAMPLPDGGICLTCGTKLKVAFGAGGLVLEGEEGAVRRKKKKRRVEGGVAVAAAGGEGGEV